MTSALNIIKPQTQSDYAKKSLFVGRRSSPILTLTPGYGRGETPLWNTFESMDFEDFDIDDLSDDSEDEMKDRVTFDDISFNDNLGVISEQQATKTSKHTTTASAPPDSLFNLAANQTNSTKHLQTAPIQQRCSLPPNCSADSILRKIPLKPCASVPMIQIKHYHVPSITIWSNHKQELEDLIEKGLEVKRNNASRRASRKQIKFKDMEYDSDDTKVEDDAMRKYLIQEIIQTEESYVKGLNTLLYEFVIPMFQKKLLKAKYKELITCNIPGLIKFHDVFLKQLVEATSVSFDTSAKRSLVSVFYKLCNDAFVDMYIKYTKEYHKILDVYAKYNKDKKLQSYLKAKRKEKKPLTNHLILPIQRVTRYLLLLQQLRNETPHKHADYKELEIVLERINQTVHAINERQREIENMSQCLQVQETMNGLKRNIVESYRKLLAQFMFRKKENQRARQFFLFNDLLIITNVKFKVKTVIDLTTIDIKRTDESNVEFQVYSLHHKAVYETDERVDLDALLDIIEDNRSRIYQQELENIGADEQATMLRGSYSVSGSSLKAHKSQLANSSMSMEDLY